jgi:hypothetical protein
VKALTEIPMKIVLTNINVGPRTIDRSGLIRTRLPRIMNLFALYKKQTRSLMIGLFITATVAGFAQSGVHCYGPCSFWMIL